MTIQVDKIELRRQLLTMRKSVQAPLRQQREAEMLGHLHSMQEFQNASVIMAYMDFRGEAPTKGLAEAVLSEKKRLVLPLTDENFRIIAYEIPVLPREPEEQGGLFSALKKSPLGIWEPDPSKCSVADLSSIDMVLVPGVAFDRLGGRLGYGKGCYDSFLPKLRPDCIKLGLAYAFQVLETIPSEPFDFRLDGLL